jgi:hypothetical protein
VLRYGRWGFEHFVVALRPNAGSRAVNQSMKEALVRRYMPIRVFNSYRMRNNARCRILRSEPRLRGQPFGRVCDLLDPVSAHDANRCSSQEQDHSDSRADNAAANNYYLFIH